MWFRRDLRLHDNPALLAAIESARATGDGRVIPLFIFDDRLWGPSGPVRRAYLLNSLRSLDASLDGHLHIRHGDPAKVLTELREQTGAANVHVAADFAPYGVARDTRVASVVPLERTGSPYAVAPGRVVKDDGTPFRVFTPFYKAWMRHGWRAPADDIPADVHWWSPAGGSAMPEMPDLGSLTLPTAGEQAAWQRWEAFRADALADYAEERNRPDINGTSSLSAALRWGEIHPRSLLAELSDSDEVFRKEICWREFYADVLHQRPESARISLDDRFDAAMRWNTGTTADALFEAWALGRTGYPFVDAGMRQLRAEGWVHNRVRMVVASFLIKDLHLPWQRGAAEFMHWLRDGDLASNSHGWQWTAGCGTDAAPFYRVFNPVLQGLKFDPDGNYVRRYVPELAHLPGKSVHEPWDAPDGYAHGYPERIVEHATERDAALADFQAIKR